VRDIGMDQLEHELGTNQIAQSMLAQRQEVGLLRQRVADEFRRQTRKQDLPSATYGAQSRDATQRRSEVVVVAFLRFASVDRHPHADCVPNAPFARRESALGVSRSSAGIRASGPLTQ